MNAMRFNSSKTLRVRWCEDENDWMIDYPTKATGSMTAGFIDGSIDFPEFIKELKSRGYNVDTLEINVQKREFKCIKDCFRDGKKVFSKDEIAYMKYDDNDSISLTNTERYSYHFSKSKKGEYPYAIYFVEI
jgi:hypothetical protein